MTQAPATPAAGGLFNKVTEVTAMSWIIRIPAATVGETGADCLIFRMGLGLPPTSVPTAGCWR